MKTLDLHSLRREQAISKIVLFIEEIIENEIVFSTIITGKGTGALRILAIEELSNYSNLTWEVVNDGGAILITNHLNNQNTDFENYAIDEYPVLDLDDKYN